MQKEKFLQWINKNDFWKSEFINYRNSNLDLFFDPKLKDVKNLINYYILKYGYVTFDENILKYNPVDSTEKDFTEYRKMNRLFNAKPEMPDLKKKESEIKRYIDLLKPIKDSKPIKDFQSCKEKVTFSKMISSFNFKIENQSAFSSALFKISPNKTFKNPEQIRNKFRLK